MDRPLKDGDKMIVSHQFADGEVQRRNATLRFPVEGSSWSVLEYSRQAYFAATRAARSLFLAAEDLPIPDHEDWFMISDFPVELSKHTAGKIVCMTKVYMESLG